MGCARGVVVWLFRRVAFLISHLYFSFLISHFSFENHSSDVSLQLLYHLVDLLQFPWYANVLRAVWFTLSAADAVVGLSLTFDRAVEADEILTAVLAVVGRTGVVRQRPFVLALVVVDEDARDINAIGARHAVLAVVAGNGLNAHDLLSHLFVQELLLFLGQRLQWAVAEQVVLEVFHIGHAAQYGEHAFESACVAESPRGHRLLWLPLLQFRHDELWQAGQSSA